MNYLMNGLAALAFIVLFSQCAGKTDNQTTSTPAQANAELSGMKIAYVEIDTLLAKYNFCIDLNEAMVKKSENVRMTLNQKMTALNKEKQEFQKKYESNAFLSPERAQQEYNRLAKMEQDLQELSNKLQNGLMEDNLGSKGRKFMAPFIVTLFMFILVANELGILLPQIGVHWTSPTNDINTCFALSLLIAFSAYCVGVAKQGIGHFKHFISPSPAFLPLHLLDAVTKPLTMALRLFGNILAGEILLIVLYQLAPWVVPELWVMFSLFIGFVQAFIFTILSLGSYALAFASHDEH